MGARAQVHIKDTGVYLYTHWGAGRIFEDVADAIQKNWRWDDPEYLTRIIFDVMKRSDIEGETGFSIGTGQHGDIERLVVVDCKNKQVSFNEIYEPNSNMSYSFRDVTAGIFDEA